MFLDKELSVGRRSAFGSGGAVDGPLKGAA